MGCFTSPWLNRGLTFYHLFSCFLILFHFCSEEFRIMAASTREKVSLHLPEQTARAPESMDINLHPLTKDMPQQPNVSGTQNTAKLFIGPLKLWNSVLHDDASLSDRVAVLERVKRLMEHIISQASSFSKGIPE
jgi:hypothetical protein